MFGLDLWGCVLCFVGQTKHAIWEFAAFASGELTDSFSPVPNQKQGLIIYRLE